MNAFFKVVIAFFGIVVAAFVALNVVFSINYRIMHSPEARNRAIMSQFISGLQSYEHEYNRLPTEVLTSHDPRTLHRTLGAILDVLNPRDKTPAYPRERVCNPRRIDFFDPPVAKEKRGGLYYDEQNEPVVVDPWGEPYYFNFSLTFNTDSKKQVPNPDPRDNKEHPYIETSVIMFSAGPDGDPRTWDDNILSWK